MALFKISKGLSKNLMTNVPYAKEGFAYFTSDDGKFYIDVEGDGTNASPAVIGDNRIPLSALSTDWIKATKIEDTETYPILAFKVIDSAINLIELKYGSIGYKDGTLVIPNVETGSKDEVLIENNDEGSALIIDNKGAGIGIKIINTGKDSLVNNQGININDNIRLNMNGSASFEGDVVIGGTYIFKGSPANILGTNKTNTIISNQLTLQQGAVFSGNAQNAGLVTRGICGVSTPTDDGACEKDNLYINYDGDNSYKASRQVILQAGKAGEDYGNHLYQYAAARGDAVHDWSLNNFYIKSDIDNKLNNLLATNDAMVFKGTIGGDAAATIHELPAKHSAGETYRVYDIKGGNNGKYLGNGEVCEIGDLIICIKDGTTHSAGDWTIVQTNIDGAVINTDGSSTDGHIAIFSGNKGRTIKDSGKSFDDLAAGNHNHDNLYVKKSGDTMTGLLKTNGSIENQGEAKFTHPDYCPDIENTAENIGCAFKASRGHFNQMNVNEIYLPATTTTNYEGNKISFKTYSGGNNGAYANVSEVAQINTTGLKVGSSSIGTNGYIEGTWLKTTNAGNKAGDFATIDGQGWIYKRTAAQVLSDIGAASSSHNHDSNYVKKTGDTMTGQLAIDKAGYGFRVNNGSTGYIELSRDNSGAQLYGLWDCIKNIWLVQSDGTNVYFHGNADSASRTLGDVNGLQIDTNYLKLSGGTMSGSINCSLPSTTSTATNTGAMICHGQVGGNNGMYVGNGDADGSILGTSGKANLIFKSWQSIGFVDGCSSTNAGITMTINTRTGVLRGNKLWGAVWNDYAECRDVDTIEPGKCVIEVGDDTLTTSTERLMPGANITSDTFGFAIGETEQAKTPIAVSGRVLAYPYESREEFKKNIGRPVCSGPNGTVSIMTDEEYRNKGYCAIGTISAVPDYEEWGTGKIKVNGRVWIKVF